MTVIGRTRRQKLLVRRVAESDLVFAKSGPLTFLEDSDLEVMVWGYPNDASEPLVLFALMTHPKSPGGEIPEAEFDVWLSTCATRICLEWLKRRDAVSHYAVSADGASWIANPVVLTRRFIDDLNERHQALHRFASYVLKDALGLSKLSSFGGMGQQN